MLYDMLSIMRQDLTVDIRNSITDDLYMRTTVAKALEYLDDPTEQLDIKNAEVTAFELGNTDGSYPARKSECDLVIMYIDI